MGVRLHLKQSFFDLCPSENKQKKNIQTIIVVRDQLFRLFEQEERKKPHFDASRRSSRSRTGKAELLNQKTEAGLRFHNTIEPPTSLE